MNFETAIALFCLFVVFPLLYDAIARWWRMRDLTSNVDKPIIKSRRKIMDNELFKINDMVEGEWKPLINFMLSDLESHVDFEDQTNREFLINIGQLSIVQRITQTAEHTYQIRKINNTLELGCLECGPVDPPISAKLRLLQ